MCVCGVVWCGVVCVCVCGVCVCVLEPISTDLIGLLALPDTLASTSFLISNLRIRYPNMISILSI